MLKELSVEEIFRSSVDNDEDERARVDGEFNVKLLFTCE